MTHSAFFLFYLLVVLVLALALGPVQPASDIVPHVLIPLLVGDLGRRGRTPAGTAEKDNVLLWLRLGEGEFLKKKKNPNGTLIYAQLFFFKKERECVCLDVTF